MLPQGYQDIRAEYGNAKLVLYDAEKGVDGETAVDFFDRLRETKEAVVLEPRTPFRGKSIVDALDVDRETGLPN